MLKIIGGSILYIMAMRLIFKVWVHFKKQEEIKKEILNELRSHKN